MTKPLFPSGLCVWPIGYKVMSRKLSELCVYLPVALSLHLCISIHLFTYLSSIYERQGGTEGEKH